MSWQVNSQSEVPSPSILKPCFDLNLREVKCTGKLDSFADCQVFIILEKRGGS